MQREPTIHDVARRAGVSVATVSRVLNGRGPVAEATRARVLAAVAELGYRPNAVARSLVRRRSCTVGVLVPDIANPFAAELVRGMEAEAAAHGYHIVLACSDLSIAQEVRYIGLFRERQVDGLIYTSGTVTPELQQAFAELGRPVVLAATTVTGPGPALPAVLVDSYAGARLAMEHVLSLGHRRVACLIGSLQDPIAGLPRWQGYRDAAAARGVEIPPEYVVDAGFRLEAAYEATVRLLRLRPRPTAVVAASDLMAIGAMGAAADRGLRVPEDLTVVGFDNIRLAAVVRPALTTVAQPMHEIGARAVSRLLQVLAGEQPEPLVDWIAPRLIVRGSSGPPPA
ncbi:MAG: LacI family transcriptional regulator [Firmicutes bacterium]|nr:LacI family transcriptional regulator [Bacillota bacterium]